MALHCNATVSIYSWFISLVLCSVYIRDAYIIWESRSVSLMVICMKNLWFSFCQSNNHRHLLSVHIFHLICYPKPFTESLNISVEHCYIYIVRTGFHVSLAFHQTMNLVFQIKCRQWYLTPKTHAIALHY